MNIRLRKETVWRVERLEDRPERKEREVDERDRSTCERLGPRGGSLQKEGFAVGNLRPLL